MLFELTHPVPKQESLDNDVEDVARAPQPAARPDSGKPLGKLLDADIRCSKHCP